MKLWMNGKLVDDAQGVVSVFDHGLLYGDGVFEDIRSYHGRIFRCPAHLDRLFASAEAIRLKIPMTKTQVEQAIYETLRADGAKDTYVRLVVTRGPGNLGLNPYQCQHPTVFIIVDQIELYPKEMYETGMAVIIAKTRRTDASMVPPSVKSLNYLNNILARMEAVDAGVPEAMMLNARGDLAEATGDNIFIVKDATVITPPPEAGILVGVTRGVVIELCAKLSLSLREQAVSVAELYTADECFLTGTAAEVIPVTRVDHREIGTGKPGAVTLRLVKAFRELIRAEAR